MSKEWKEEYQKENYKDFRDNANHRNSWEKDASRFERFRYGSHFSTSEEAELLAFRQAPLPISITTAICDSAEAMMISSKPAIKVAPIIHPYREELTNRSKKVAQIYNYLISKSWYDSLGGLQYDRVIRDSSNVGHGLFYIVPRNEYGEFTVDIKHLNWRSFYPHPLTRSPFYEDSDNMVIAMEMSKLAAFRFVKSIEPDITEQRFEEDFVKGAPSPLQATSSRYSPASQRNGSVLFVQKLVLEEQFMHIIIPMVKDLNYEESQVGYRVVQELTPQLTSMERDGKIKIVKERRLVLTEYTSIGRLGYKIVYPISNYNIVPLTYDHLDNPYPLGRVWYMYPLQRALNKFMMIALINGSLMNSMRVVYEKDSIPDIDEWKRNFAKPGAMLAWEQKIPGMTKPPTILESKPLTEAWLSMPKYITSVMEYVSGIFGVMMGDAQNSPDVFSTVASLQSAGGNKIKRRLAQSDAALSKVGSVVAEFYKEYAPPNGFSIAIDANGEMQEAQKYNVLRMTEDKQIEIDPETDLSLGFKDVRFTTQGSSGFESGTEAALMTNLATQLKVPQLLPAILRRINIPDVDKIIEDISVVNQQNATIEQLQKMVTDLDSKSKILANQVQQKGFETENAKFSSKLKEILTEVKNNPESINNYLGV
jgi:hypothetical protein